MAGAGAMNCLEFREYCSKFSAESLSKETMHNCETHLSECIECLDFFLANSSGELQAATQDSVDSILLEGMGLESCRAAEEQMADYFDSSLEEFENTLIQSHLQGCASCSAMYSIYESLPAELFSLRDLPPPVDLVDAILLKTTGEAPSLIEKLQKKFVDLMQRPRFSLEASMFGTLLWMAMFGVPAGALDRESGGLSVLSVVEQGANNTQQNLVSINTRLNSRLSRLPRILADGMQAAENGGTSLIREGVEQTLDQGDELLQRVEEFTERQTD